MKLFVLYDIQGPERIVAVFDKLEEAQSYAAWDPSRLRVTERKLNAIDVSRLEPNPIAKPTRHLRLDRTIQPIPSDSFEAEVTDTFIGA